MNPSPLFSSSESTQVPRLVALTGGPGAGKTAFLEIVRIEFREHVVVLPEAAAIVYGGGFPRRKTGAARRAGQRAIYHVERELERMALEEGGAALALCDRGTVDGLAYWPDSPESYWAELGTTLAAELGRYAAVIHLRTPPAHLYSRGGVRIESAEEARVIDERIARAWQDHPRRFTVPASEDFLDKVERTLALIRGELPTNRFAASPGAAAGGTATARAWP
jgi:predicted ATPase